MALPSTATQSVRTHKRLGRKRESAAARISTISDRWVHNDVVRVAKPTGWPEISRSRHVYATADGGVSPNDLWPANTIEIEGR